MDAFNPTLPDCTAAPLGNGTPVFSRHLLTGATLAGCVNAAGASSSVRFGLPGTSWNLQFDLAEVDPSRASRFC